MKQRRKTIKDLENELVDQEEIANTRFGILRKQIKETHKDLYLLATVSRDSNKNLKDRIEYNNNLILIFGCFSLFFLLFSITLLMVL